MRKTFLSESSEKELANMLKFLSQIKINSGKNKYIAYTNMNMNMQKLLELNGFLKLKTKQAITGSKTFIIKLMNYMNIF